MFEMHCYMLHTRKIILDTMCEWKKDINQKFILSKKKGLKSEKCVEKKYIKKKHFYRIKLP